MEINAWREVPWDHRNSGEGAELAVRKADDERKYYCAFEIIKFIKSLLEASSNVLAPDIPLSVYATKSKDAEYEQCVLDNKNLTIEKKNLLIKNDCLIAECLEKDICSIVFTSDSVVPPSSNCLCEDLRSACDREHTKVLELEAEISKQKQLITESEKRFAFLEQNYVNLQLKFQNYKQCIDTSSASNAIFEINKLRQQLQGKDDTIRNLDAQINIMKVLNVGTTEGSCDQQALETDRIQLKDTITSLRIQLDGLKVENVSLKRRYDELSKANTHSRTAYTEKLSAFTAEHTKLKAQVTGTTSSGPSTSETPKVLAPGMYNLGSKYIPPPKRANWVKPTPLPKKKQVTFSEPPRPSLKPTQKPVVHPKNKLPASLPVKSANARRVEAHHRTLNKKNRVDSNLLVKHSVSVSNLNNVCGGCNKSLVFANHNDCLVMCDDSVNVKPHQTKRFTRQPKKEWKPIKKVWKPISKPVANSKPQWKPTGRHFSLFEKYPLTRIMEPTEMPIELPPSASSSPQITMVSRFIDHKLSDRKAGSKGISVQIVLWYLDSGCSRHMTGDRARLINFVDKFIGTVRFGNDEYAAIIGYGDYKLGDTIISRVYYVEGLKHNLFSVGQFCDGGLEVAFRQHSCHIRNYDMVDLLKGSRTTNLYSISLNDSLSLHQFAMLTKASSTKSWFKASTAESSEISGTLNELLEIILFWLVRFLRSKDETPQVIEKFIVKTQRALNATVPSHTDNGTDIRNRTLMEAARTMLIFAKAPLFLWAEAVATRVYTIIDPLVHTLQRGKTYPALRRERNLISNTSECLDLCAILPMTTMMLFKPPPQQMTSVPNSTELELTALQSGRSRSALVKDPEPPSVPPTKKQVDDLFQWFDDDEVVPIPPVVPITPVNVPAAPTPENANGSPSTTVILEGGPAVTESLLPHQIPLPDTSDSDDETLFDHVDNRPISTRKQLETDAMWCFFNEFLTHVEPKTYKQALEHSCWIEAMQEEIHEFKRLDNKARLVAKGLSVRKLVLDLESFAPVAILEAIRLSCSLGKFEHGHLPET
ncbi:uncharacterized mitochondrial protein-like protein [Tanacetum coccineum]